MVIVRIKKGVQQDEEMNKRESFFLSAFEIQNVMHFPAEMHL